MDANAADKLQNTVSPKTMTEMALEIEAMETQFAAQITAKKQRMEQMQSESQLSAQLSETTDTSILD